MGTDYSRFEMFPKRFHTPQRNSCPATTVDLVQVQYIYKRMRTAEFWSGDHLQWLLAVLVNEYGEHEVRFG